MYQASHMQPKIHSYLENKIGLSLGTQAVRLMVGGVHKCRKSAEKSHFIPFFSILKGPEGQREFNSAISYITTVISTSFIYNHSDFDLIFSSSFEKVMTFSKLELKNKSKSLWLYIKEVEITV